jgi:hypothetical protein
MECQTRFPVYFLFISFQGSFTAVANGLELDIGELAANATNFTQVFVLHDVARLRIDRDRAKRLLAGRSARRESAADYLASLFP